MPKFKMTFFKKLYVQVLIGILVGIILGVFYPDFAILLKPCSDVFIKLVKMLIAPIIFLTLVSGIAAMHDMRSVGKIASSALVYFIFTTTFALLLGLFAAHMIHPGAGLNIHIDTLDMSAAKHYLPETKIPTTAEEFLLNIIPHSFLSAFVDGEILQTLLIAILFSVGMIMVGERAKPVLHGIQTLSQIFFSMIHFIMYLAPIAACAAMGFSLAKYGVESLWNMLFLIFVFYSTCALFIVLILGSILRFYCRINLFKLLRYIRTELLIVLGTSSSEVALPNLIEKLELLGCKKSVVGLVLPVGYSFNLDGTAIYLTLAALFIAQALHIDLTVWQQFIMIVVMIVSSKGAAGVTGSGFVVLASSLAATGYIPVAGIILVLGIDRFMSDGRAITNMTGNTIACIIISVWQRAFDHEKANEVLNRRHSKEAIALQNIMQSDSAA